MNTLIVVESMFGNTHQIGEAIADGLSRFGPATLLDVSEAPPNPHGTIDLLVVGGPTHVFGLSRPLTRQSAAQEGADVHSAGLREWFVDLAKLQPDAPGCYAAAFDTRIDAAWLPGSAAKAAARRLRRHGYTLIAPPEDFSVIGTEGPVHAGELDRARAWAIGLGRRFERTRRHPRIA